MPFDLGDIIEEAIVFVETGAVDSTDVAPDNVGVDGEVATVLADLELVASIYVVLMNVGLLVEQRLVPFGVGRVVFEDKGIVDAGNNVEALVIPDVFAVGSIVVAIDVNVGFLEAVVFVVGIVDVAEDCSFFGEIVDMSVEMVLDIGCFIVVADAEIVSVVDDLLLVEVDSSIEDVELIDADVENTEERLRFDVDVAVDEDAAVTDRVFVDAEALELVEEYSRDTKDVEVDNVVVDAEDTEVLCVTVFEFVEYVDILDVGIKVGEAEVIIDVVVWGVNDALLLYSGIFVVEYDASGNAVDMAPVVMVAEVSADVKLGFVGVVGVAAGELTDVVFIALIDTVLFIAGFVVDAECAEIVEVADEVLSLIMVFENGCGVVEYMEFMDVRFVDVEDEDIVDVGSVVVTIEAVSDKGCGVVEYMKLIGVGVVNAKDVGVVILDDVGLVE